MSLSPSDEDLALFAKIPRSRLEAIVALAARTPDDFEQDTLYMLELAERMGVPGQIDQSLFHDGRGRVGAVKHAPQWHRQAKRKTA
jgi:hypothetical protein